MKRIFINQEGYLPSSKKEAGLLNSGTFFIKNEKNETVFSGETTDFGKDASSEDYLYLADFSKLNTSGKYYIEDSLGEKSYTFEIKDRLYENLLYDLTRTFYFQRCGCALMEKYAGIYKHECCHTGKTILFDDTSVTKDMSGGWHDAGDFGRYASPGAVAIAHMLYAYFLFPESFENTLNIPESGNGVPDVLNECRYELEWLLKCQREDGAVYHKVSTLHHAAFVMPEKDLNDLYAYPISSMATGDFAAVMALGYRIYHEFDTGFANSMLEASKKSYEWLKKNPEFTGFKNPPGTGTGEYGDWSDKDERLWAATELLVATLDDKYIADLDALINEKVSLTGLGWGEVSGFATICALSDFSKAVPQKYIDIFKEKGIMEAKKLAKKRNENGYRVAMAPSEFGWGSNGNVGNRGMLFILAGLLTKDSSFFDYAADQLHYLLGRNALGYSYVTGHGEHAFMRPHNRPTEADGIELPIPGFVSGGPNGRPCDEAAKNKIPEGTPPMKCYIDDWKSYSTNEVAIYWNSPFVFITAALLALQ